MIKEKCITLGDFRYITAKILNILRIVIFKDSFKGEIIMRVKYKIILVTLFLLVCIFLPVRGQFSTYVSRLLNTSIYNIGTELTYEYQFIPFNKKDSLNIKLIEDEAKTIDNIVMKVVGAKVNEILNLNLEDMEVLNDRLLRNSYPPLALQDAAAIIENNEKVWIHPPRLYFFRILELNPFPYILKPYEIGKEWDWNLDIGQQYGNSRWKEWKGNITNHYNYKIIGHTMLKTDLGNLSCFIVESYATSTLGKTYLRSYFNEKYGFVRLIYVNIDGSKIILNLSKFTSRSRKTVF